MEFRGKAEDDLAKLERPLRRRIIDRLEWLAENFEDITLFSLGGEWKGFFKFRAGDWRIIYTIESTDKAIAVHYIDNRDKIYKRKR